MATANPSADAPSSHDAPASHDANPPTAPAERNPSMLSARLAIGALLIAVLTGACYLDLRALRPGMYLLPLAIVVAVLASFEIVRLMAAVNLRPPKGLVIVGNALIVAANGAIWIWDDAAIGALGWPLLMLGLVVILGMARGVERYTPDGAIIQQLAGLTWGLVYVGVLLSFLCQLRMLGVQSIIGLVGLISLVAVVKLCDVGAYTVGRLLGRTKLAPHISPGKTLEGAVGGLLFGALGAWLSIEVLGKALGLPAGIRPPGGWIVYGLILSCSGILGDLAESILKRDAKIKDSGAWVPGFGGVLDILDSLLFSAPVAYLFWLKAVSN